MKDKLFKVIVGVVYVGGFGAVLAGAIIGIEAW